jgi:putative nucleotidyltransferase-like protein
MSALATTSRVPLIGLLTKCCVLPVDERRAKAIASFLADSAIDWEDLIMTAAENRVIPQVYLCLSSLESSGRASVPSQVLSTLKTLYNKQVANSFRVAELLNNVLKSFSQEGVQTILIKGAAASRYGYDFPNIREMLDVDLLLVDAESAETAMRLLLGMGLTQEKVSHLQRDRSGAGYKFQYISGGGPLGIDLHAAVGTGGFAYLPSSALSGRALKVRVGLNGASVTCPEDTLLVTCANAVGGGRFLIRDLLDTVTVLAHGHLDWSDVLEGARPFGLVFPLYSQLALASELDETLGLQDFRDRFMHVLPTRFQGCVLDASRFGDKSRSISLKSFRDNYFLPSKLGHTYPVRNLATATREMMREWAKEGDIYGGLSEFVTWKSKEMIKRAAKKLSSTH